jgi:hypothetical protein
MALRFLNNGYFAGKVGIGVEVPLTTLHLNDPDGSIIRLSSDAHSDNNKIEFDALNNGSIYHSIVSNTSTGNLQLRAGDAGSGHEVNIYTDGLFAATFSHEQRLGVGIETPQGKLHVATGSIHPSSSVASSSNSVIFSGQDGLMDLLSYDDNSTVATAIGMGRYDQTNGNIIDKWGLVTWYDSGNEGSNLSDRLGIHYGTNKAPWSNNEVLSITREGKVGIDSTDPTEKLTVNGNVKGDSFGTDESSTARIFSPEGAVYNGSGSQTGYLIVKLPDLAGEGINNMMSGVIRVFDYASGHSFDVHFAGYWYSGYNWTRCTAWVDSEAGTDRNFSVRFGKMNGSSGSLDRAFITIGEGNSTWSYCKFSVIEYTSGHANAQLEKWNSGWETGISSTFPGTLIVNVTNAQINNWQRTGQDVYYGGGTGNVGIGTTTPSQRTVISGSTTNPTLNTTAVSNASLLVSNSDVGYGTYFASTGGGIGLIQQRRNTSAVYYDLSLQPYGGNVGIGITSPAAKLDVYDPITTAANTVIGQVIKNYVGGSGIFRVGLNAGNTTADIEMNSGGAGPFRYGSYGEMNIVNNRPSSKINFVNNSSIAVTINDDGYVGIGDNTPTVPLEVANTSSTSFTYQRTGVSANKWGFHSDNDATYWQNVTSGNLLFTLQNAGNVGINTTQPSEKLDVDGNARVRNLTAGIVTSSATGVLSTGGPTPMNMSLGESYAANIREKYYRTNRTVYPSTIGSQFAQLIQQDLLNSMSLIMSPVATQTSEVSSVRPENNSGDFSFTRATKASRVASSGYIVRQTENYLRYSNEFNNSSYWTLGDATVTWGQADYFGKSTAWKLQDTASTAQHFVRQTTGIGGIVTVSVYAKAGTKSFLYLRGVEGTTSKETFFNLSAGTVGTVEGITASMEAIGSGWYRCSASFDHNPPYEYYFGVADADNVTSYTGDGTGNIYIVNPQIESGIGAREYNGTTSSIFYGGETSNVPRIDYKNGVPELLLEKTSTNVVYCSAKMAYLGHVTQSFTLSPEGILNGIKINETATSNQHYGHVNCSVVAGTQYFLSFYIKKGTASTVTVYTQSNTIGSNATVNLDNGTISASGTDAFIEDVGGGWYRAGYKTPAALQTATSMDIYLPVTNLSSYAGDVNNYTEYYGIQLETAPIVTSHIPTYDGAITRNNEIISLSNMATNTIASNATAGTLMVEFSNNYTNAGDTLQWHQSPTIIGRGYFYVRQIGFADSWGASGLSTTDGVNTKVIWRLNSLTSGSFFKDGVKSGQTVTGTAWADINKLVIRSDFGTMRIRNIFMSPTALTDDQCVKLTTINE